MDTRNGTRILNVQKEHLWVMPFNPKLGKSGINSGLRTTQKSRMRNQPPDVVSPPSYHARLFPHKYVSTYSK